MAKKHDVISSYNIALNQKVENKIVNVGNQEISFVNEKNVLYFGTPALDPAATLSFTTTPPIFKIQIEGEEKTFEVITANFDEKNNLELDIKSNELHVDKISIDEAKITFKNNKSKEEQSVSLQTEDNNTNMYLPENFFHLIANGKIETKHFPSQMFEAVLNLPGIEVISIPYKSKHIKLAKITNPKNGEATFFLSHSTKMFSLDSSDMFAYKDTKTKSKKSNYLGIVLGKAGEATKGLQIKDLTDEQMTEIKNFVESTPTQQIVQIDTEQYESQLIRLTTVQKARAASKRLQILEEALNNLGGLDEEPKEETPEETPSEETPGEETPGEEAPGEETPGEDPEEKIIKDPVDEDPKDEPKDETKDEPKDEPKKELDEERKKIEEEKLSPEDAEKKKSYKEEYEKTKKELDEANKKLEKGKTKPETVDLTHVAKFLGILGAIFGLFGGFGLLFQIVVMGLASSGWTFSKKLSEVGKVNTKDSKNKSSSKPSSSKDKEIDVTKESTAEKENRYVDELVKLGLLPKEEAEKFKNMSKNFEENTSKIDQARAYMTDQIQLFTDLIKDLDEKANKAHNKGKTEQEKLYLSQKAAIEKDRQELIDIQKEFEGVTEDVSKQINDALKFFVKIQELTNEIAEYPEKLDKEIENLNVDQAELTADKVKTQERITAIKAKQEEIEASDSPTKEADLKEIKELLEKEEELEKDQKVKLTTFQNELDRLNKLKEEKETKIKEYNSLKSKILDTKLEKFASIQVGKVNKAFKSFREKLQGLLKNKDNYKPKDKISKKSNKKSAELGSDFSL